jgi:hypothetical protein
MLSLEFLRWFLNLGRRGDIILVQNLTDVVLKTPAILNTSAVFHEDHYELVL